jgi:hypothetical protein
MSHLCLVCRTEEYGDTLADNVFAREMTKAEVLSRIPVRVIVSCPRKSIKARRSLPGHYIRRISARMTALVANRRDVEHLCSSFFECTFPSRGSRVAVK